MSRLWWILTRLHGMSDTNLPEQMSACLTFIHPHPGQINPKAVQLTTLGPSPNSIFKETKK